MSSDPSREERARRATDGVQRLGLASALYSDACAGLADLHPTDWRILDALCQLGPMSAGEVAEYLGISNGAVTGAVDRLERAGGARRVRDAHDRRRVILEVVKQGNDEITHAYARLEAELDTIHSRLGDDDLAVVLAYLNDAQQAIERTTHAIRKSTSQRPG